MMEENNMPAHEPIQNNAPMPQPTPSTPLPTAEPPKKKKFRIDKSAIAIFLAIVAILIIAVFFFANLSTNNMFSFLTAGSGKVVAEKAINYLNKQVLQAGQVATLGDVAQESGIVKFQVKIDGNSYTSYVTKDGKLFFPQAYNLSGVTTTGQTTPGVDVKNVKTEGNPFIGDVKARVVMAYWTDYQCPFCKRSEQQVISQLIKDYVDSGKMRIIFKDYAFLGDDSKTAALAGRAVWEIAPTKFYTWHSAMFAKQDNENGGWGKKADILALTQSLGIDSAKVGQLMAQKATQYQAAIDADKTEGSSLGISGTPGAIVGTHLISGAQSLDVFKTAIDAELAK